MNQTGSGVSGRFPLLRGDGRGSVMIEFAFCAPLLILMALGVADLARVMSESIAMASAVRLGATYGIRPGKANDVAGMQQAALNDLANVSGVTVTVTQSCHCASTQIPCHATCSSAKPIFVTVRAAKQFHALAPFGDLPTGFWISNEATMRAK